MPLFSVVCPECKANKDLLLKSNEHIPKDLRCHNKSCTGIMVRDFMSEKPAFLLKGSCWERDNYGRSHKAMVQESDNECLETEKRRIKRDKLNGTY